MRTGPQLIGEGAKQSRRNRYNRHEAVKNQGPGQLFFAGFEAGCTYGFQETISRGAIAFASG